MEQLPIHPAHAVHAHHAHLTPHGCEACRWSAHHELHMSSGFSFCAAREDCVPVVNACAVDALMTAQNS
eukprot:3943011-Prymnesium_polylepis.2